MDYDEFYQDEEPQEDTHFEEFEEHYNDFEKACHE